jgi:hypothetical protein
VTSETLNGKGHGSRPSGRPSNNPDRGQGGYGGGSWGDEHDDGIWHPAFKAKT